MSIVELIKELASPMAVEPTDEQPRLQRFPNLKAVVFDVYGTLFQSGSGDIGLSEESDAAEAAMAEALQAEGFVTSPAMRLSEELKRLIQVEHAKSKAAGTEHPEIEIREIWKAILTIWRLELEDATLERAIVRHESRVNPTALMPGVERTLAALRETDLALGIISNAQFYTPPLFDALLGQSLEALGFTESLCLWSYREREAKPSHELFRRERQLLAQVRINPEDVLYVGNDMRNDVAPAAAVGFKTALFAGDARSLRWRHEDELDVKPDLILTELDQLLECVGPLT